jgi:hypothetical protein
MLGNGSAGAPTCVSGATCCQPGANSSSHRQFELHAQPMRDDRDRDGPAGFRKQLTEQVRREPSASGHMEETLTIAPPKRTNGLLDVATKISVSAKISQRMNASGEKMDCVEVKSCHGRASLSMRVTSRALDETLFIATLTDSPFHGEVRASTYAAGSISVFFREMAKAWTGWDGAKGWTSIDGELKLSATITRLWQVALTIELSSLTSSMSTHLALEAGSLE